MRRRRSSVLGQHDLGRRPAGASSPPILSTAPAFAVIQPHAVALYPNPPGGSPRNVWAATVTDIDLHADRVRVRLEGTVPLVAEITPAALDALSLRPGDTIWAAVKATEIITYPA